jgi:hypothetical protein
MAAKLASESVIFQTALDAFDLDGLRIATGRFAIVPQLGGKILNLKNRRSGRERMWRPKAARRVALELICDR